MSSSPASLTPPAGPWVADDQPLAALALDGGRVGRLILDDGRALTYAEYGDPDGVAVIELHGGGASHLSGLVFHREALEHGVRIIAVDRPGAGGSTLHDGYSVASFPRDLEQLVDALGLSRFVVMGNSNGGMMTMSVAHALPERVILALPCNPASPLFDDPLVRELVPGIDGVLAAGLDMLVATMRQQLTSLLDGDVALWSAPPFESGTAETEPEVIATYASAVLPTQEATLATEASLAFLESWGFDINDVQPRVEFISGRTEIGTPFNKIWAERLPNATLHEIRGGHCSQVDPAQRQWLMRRIVQAYSD